MSEENKKTTAEKESFIKRLSKNKTAQVILGIVFVLLVIASAAYWKIESSRIYIDKSDVAAPEINLAPTASGVIEHIMVNVGDSVSANTVVAQVGNELLKTQTAGVIVSTDNAIGTLANPSQTVVSMIDPSRLRVVGHVDEDKGLSSIKVGEPAIFTVDTFGSKQYTGVVDEVSSTARSGDVVFSISDKRPTQVFDIKVRFDQTLYPEIKNGMSARLWIYKQ